MKNKNTFTFSLVHAMKKNFIVPVLTFIGLLGCLIVSFSQYSYSISSAMDEAMFSNQSFREILRDDSFRFIFFTNTDTLYLLPTIGIIGASALLGILLFRFVSNKKTVNVYYSLGITRKELYTARYLAGIIMLFGAIITSFLIMALVNIYCFGSSVMLWKTAFFFTLHFCVMAFAAFSIATAVSSSVGTIFESIGFSAIIILSASIVMICVTDAIPFMLLGAPKSTYIDSYMIGSINNAYYSGYSLYQDTLLLSNSFLGKILQNVDLIFLNFENIFVNGICHVGRVIDESTLNAWRMPTLTPYIFWTIGSVCFFLLGLFMFKHKKAEICGFMGRNKVLNFIISAIISFAAFCGVISILGSEVNTQSGSSFSFNMWNRTLIGIVISFLVFSVVELLLTRSFKSYKRNIKISLIHIGLMIFFVFSLHLGFFGYSSYVPDIEDVKSVSVSTPSTLMGSKIKLYPAYSDFYWLNDTSDETFPGCYYTSNTGGYMLDEFKDKESIQSVIDFHQKMIDEGWVYKESYKERLDYSNRTVKANATIIYTLKDGRKIARGYERLPVDLYEEMFKIEDSEKWNKIAEFELSTNLSQTTIPVIFSKQMVKKTFVDENLVNGLGQALVKDIKDLNYTSFWRSDANWLGAVVLFDHPTLGDDMSYYDGYETVDPSEYSSDTDYFNELASKNWKIGDEAEYTPLICNNYVIPITSEMKNTIAFLQSNGLYEALSDDSEIVSARVIDAAEATAYRGWSENDIIFNAFWDNGKAKPQKFENPSSGYYYETNYTSGDYMPESSVKVTDKQLLNNLQSNAYGIYLDTDGGYIVEFTRENGNTTIMYVPSGRISQEIK